MAVTSAGISFTPWFTRTSVLIPWSNVMFVSPVPGVRRAGRGWVSFQGEPITPDALRTGFKFYSFQIALIDRKQAFEAVSRLMKFYLSGRLLLRPLYTWEDKPHATNGIIEAQLNARWVKRHGAELLRALDVVAAHSRFDVVCWS